MVMGCSKVNDAPVVNPDQSQLKSASTKKITTAHTGSFTSPSDEVQWYLWCGEKEIGLLQGTMNFHCTMQYENDVLLFMNMDYYGSFTIEGKDEVFKFKQIEKYDLSKGNDKVHFNVIGDKGSHYIVSITYLTGEPWVVLNKAQCE